MRVDRSRAHAPMATTKRPTPPWVAESISRARLASTGGAYTHITAAEAENFAADVRPDAPLAGWTFAVKDNIAVCGVPLRAGSRVRESAPSEPADAPFVRDLKKAGATLLGSTAMHELAFGVTGINPYTGTPKNPIGSGLVPGGSSCGSAVAVATGSATVAIGTDTGGSVRIPAAFCGVVGWKAQRGGWLPGVLPLAPTLDHIGYLARSARDLTQLYKSLGGAYLPRERPPRLGIACRELECASPEVARAVEAAMATLEQHGCGVVVVTWPAEKAVFAASTTIMFAEAAAVHAADLRACPNRFGTDVRRRLCDGAAIPVEDYVHALRERARIRRQVSRLFTRLDAVIGPTVGVRPPTIARAGDASIPPSLVANTRLANLVNAAAISLPLDGLGTGLQITAQSDREALATAAWIEARLAVGYGAQPANASARARPLCRHTASSGECR
jgi:Asp-tRNA(Asn)/Glu-tRNA(Gln) amidotransferase A subunit family amidase